MASHDLSKPLGVLPTPRRELPYTCLERPELWMLKQLKHTIRIVKRFVSHLTGLPLAMIYAPRQVLKEDSSSRCDVTRVRIDDCSYSLARIRQGRLFTNRVTNISVISGNKLVPTVSWQWQDGRVLADADNFLLQGKLPIHHIPKHFNCEVVSLLTGGGGNYNYYHWLFDCLPRLYIAKPFINVNATTKYLIPEDTLPFQRETMEALGIPVTSRISSKEYRHLRANLLLVLSHPNPDPTAIPAWIMRFLRESFLVTSSLATTKSDFVYISRGDSVNSRRLLNESHFSKILESIGFGIYHLSELTFQDQVVLFSEARMIVGVHGAGFANLAFASRGTVVYELFSDQYKPKLYERLSALADLDYHGIICEDEEVEKPAQQANLSISDGDIMKILRHAEQIAAGDASRRT